VNVGDEPEATVIPGSGGQRRLRQNLERYEAQGVTHLKLSFLLIRNGKNHKTKWAIGSYMVHNTRTPVYTRKSGWGQPRSRFSRSKVGDSELTPILRHVSRAG